MIHGITKYVPNFFLKSKKYFFVLLRWTSRFKGSISYHNVTDVISSLMEPYNFKSKVVTLSNIVYFLSMFI